MLIPLLLRINVDTVTTKRYKTESGKIHDSDNDSLVIGGNLKC